MRRAHLASAFLLLAPRLALAGPQGEQVVSGSADFARDGDTTHITTHTPQTVVNYTGFDIALPETVLITQPDAMSRIVNNVLSTDPTRIEGRLSSNGQVWIVNPVGVFFGGKAIVDVGGLVAAAGHLDGDALLAGTEQFKDLSGRVEVASGAQIVAADSVLLLGGAVANYGNIRAPDGMVALVAGGEVRLARVDGSVVVTADRAVAPDPDRWAVAQGGSIEAGRVSLIAGDAYSLAMNHTGITRAKQIDLAGGDGAVSVAGTLDAASDAAGGTGGKITVTGGEVVVGAAELDASGDAGGGEIRVGGDYRGGGDLKTARRTYIAADAVLRADAGSQGDGGKIIVWADDATRFYGTLSARGGRESGDGGFAEISGESLVSRGQIDLGADAGRAGTLLYDPKDIVIVGGTGDGSDDPNPSADQLDPAQVSFGTPDEATTPFTIRESEIEGTDANIVLEATNSITATGNFNHVGESGDVAGTLRISDGNSLAMSTRNSAGDEVGGAADPGIDLNGLDLLTSGGGSVTLATGNGDLSVGDIDANGSNGATGGAGGTVALTAGGTGSVTAGAIEAKGGEGSAGSGGAGGTVSLSAVDGNVTAGSVNVSGGKGMIGGNGGTINLVADLDPQSSAPVTPSGTRIVTAGGNLSALGGEGTGGAGGTGGQMLISAGWVGNQGSVVLGPGVTFDASGGKGTTAGGDTATGGTSAFSGATIGAIRIEAHGDVTGGARLVASGGDTDGSAAQGGSGGLGGAVSIGSEVGDVALDGADPIAVLDGGSVNAGGQGQGRSAGSLAIDVAGDGASISVGRVQALGGVGVQGNGGAGGSVTLTAADGPISFSGAILNGGEGTGTVTTSGGVQGVTGGSGGNVTITGSAGESDTAIGGGDIALRGDIESLGGDGDPDPGATDPNENDGLGGAVKLTSVKGVAASGGNAGIQAHTIQLTGKTVGGTAAPDIVLGGAGTGPMDTVDTATVQGAGNIRVALDNTDHLDRFEVIQTSASGNVDVLRSGGGVIAEGNGGSTVHTIQQLNTNASDPHFTYRLDDPLEGPSGGVEQIDFTTLAVAGNAVHLGANGGVLANASADTTQPDGERLVGHIQGTGAGTHVTTAGDLEIFATNIGDTGRLRVNGTGAEPDLDLIVSGDAFADVSGAIAGVELEQRATGGDVDLTLPGGGVARITGAVVDTGANRVETSTVTRVDTAGAGTDFFYTLVDPTASTDDVTPGAPTLTIASGAVTLDEDAVASFASTGNLVLGVGSAPAIDAAGGTVVLTAGATTSLTGAIVASGSANPDIANAGALVALAGAGVGTAAAPLRTSAGPDGLQLAGTTASGDFQVANQSGAIAVQAITITPPGETPETIPGTASAAAIAAAGDVLLDNGGRDIVLGPAQPESQPALLPHVASGGDQRYVGNLLLANPRDVAVTSGGVTTTVTVNEASLSAGGDVSIEGDVDTDPALVATLPGSLTVNAAGTTTFAGDVGHDAGGAPSVDTLTVSDAVFSAGAHTVTVANGNFSRIDGPGSVALRAIGPDAAITLRDDVGGREALAGFAADANLLVFADDAHNIAAGSVALNAAQPRAAVPAVATIAGTSGGLAILSAGDIAIGPASTTQPNREKLAVDGPLTIVAGGAVTAGDIAATELTVSAPQIVIQGREPAAVALPSGGFVNDYGVDWTANNINTSVAPTWNGVGTAPTFVLGSGGISNGGAPFDVVRFTSGIDPIQPSNFLDASTGQQLDLTGLGARVVGDASEDYPREAPAVRPAREAHFSETEPAPEPSVTIEEVLRAIRCETPEGEACVPGPIGDGTLDSERAHQLARNYHALIGGAQGRDRLAAAFAPLAVSDVARAPSGNVDGRALYRSLATAEALTPARERIDELAVILAQISLLGLDGAETAAVRRAVAGDFAAATGVQELDADAVLDAVAASGVGALPPNAPPR